MKVCKYCGRNLIKDYLYCPGCGSQSFKNVEGTTETYVVETPPAGGYKIDTSYFEKQLQENRGTSILGKVIIAIFFIFGILFDTLGTLFELFFFIVCGGVTSATSDIRISKARKAIDDIYYLSKNGVLIKNMPYTIEKYYPYKNTHNRNTRSTIQYRIAINYTDKEGKVHHYVSEPKREYKLHDADGKADLLIDPNNIGRYYIDVDIH